MERAALILNHSREFRIPGVDYSLLHFIIETLFLYNEYTLRKQFLS